MARLFTTLRWLRKYASKNGHQVFIRVRIRNGFETEIPVYDFVNNAKISISVKKEHWNKGHITGGRYHIPIRDINNLLTKVEGDVKDAVNMAIANKIQFNRENLIRLTYINELTEAENERKIASGELIVDEQGGAFASEDEFVDFISNNQDPKFDKLKMSMGLFQRRHILDYWDEFIEKHAPNSYTAPRHAIAEYISTTDDNCLASDFSSAWLERFFKHIIANGYSFRKDGKNRQDYTISTINKYHKHLMSFGDFLFNHKERMLDNQEYRRFELKMSKKKPSIIKYKPEAFINTHALYKSEFDKFYFHVFKDEKNELARDMFIIQTWAGGLRWCDFNKLTDDNIHRDSNGDYRIIFKQQKTDSEVRNKINKHYLNPLLKKYSGKFGSFLKVHEYNKVLKVAAEEAGLNRKLQFRYEYAKDNKPSEEWIAIHKMISNSWARNCAVSILAEYGFADYKISKFIGHKDPDMVQHYKNIHQKDVDAMIDEVKPESV